MSISFQGSTIDLERSELRYIFYSKDQPDLIQDFINLGFNKLIYEESPVTRTIYFGSKTVGLKPGLSIKARIYSPIRSQNIVNFNEYSVFNLIEIKTTVGQEEAYLHGLVSDADNEEPFISKQLSKDLLFRIQRASEDGILRDSTLKTKSRLKRGDVSLAEMQTTLEFKDIVKILTKPSELDERLSDDLKNVLNSQVRPLYHNTLIPYVMTQYSRIHLVPENANWKDLIRITIDPGVEYYDILMKKDQDFLLDQKTTAELISREKFCRLEFKLDPVNIKQHTNNLDHDISSILRNYGVIAYLSKKWTGVTIVSERHINKQAFWCEPLEREISGFFPVDPSWFAFGGITIGLFKLITHSKSFSTFEKNPRVLVKNENYVTGYLGLPTPSLVIKVEGPFITYNFPAKSYPVMLTKGMPEFYIMEEPMTPVRQTVISSKSELDDILHPSIEIDSHSFFRSYGFLVVSNTSDRVYKITIERKTEVKGEKLSSDIYCKARYVGTRQRLYKIHETDIYEELQSFYEEFAPIMAKPLDSLSMPKMKHLDEFFTKKIK
jgi:hypothetical protein